MHLFGRSRVSARGPSPQPSFDEDSDGEWTVLTSPPPALDEWTHVDVSVPAAKPASAKPPALTPPVMVKTPLKTKTENFKKAMDKTVKNIKNKKIDRLTVKWMATAVVGIFMFVCGGMFIEAYVLEKPKRRVSRVTTVPIDVRRQNATVLQMTEKDVRSLVQENTNDVLVYFYASCLRCGHGKPVSELNAVAENFEKSTMLVVKSDLGNKKYTDEFIDDINAYPQIMFYPRKGYRQVASTFCRQKLSRLGGVRYLGDRSSRDIIAWVRRLRFEFLQQERVES